MKPKLTVEKAIAPSYWASYLINGDASGMDQEEIDACDAWIDSLAWGAPVSCEDYGFVRYHDAHRFFPFASDCQEYAFLVEAA